MLLSTGKNIIFTVNKMKLMYTLIILTELTFKFFLMRVMRPVKLLILDIR